MKYNLLFFLDYYSPGYKAGGPIVSVENLVAFLGGEANIQLITRCHDLGEDTTFPKVLVGTTNRVGKATVLYLSRKDYSFRKLAKKINAFSPHVIYLNSVFSFHFSIKILILKKLKLLPSTRLILAPRGELSKGALIFKRLKKIMYLFTAKAFNLYQGIVWQATSLYEEKNIRRLFGQRADVVIAPDLPRCPPVRVDQIAKKKNELRIVFLSRISPTKNLSYAMDCLAAFPDKNARIIFDIYGPKEDTSYWNKCIAITQRLSNAIKVKYCGEVHPTHVHKTLSKYHLFFLPTLGENYGHVIFEAFAAGCPVLISDQTPWRNLEASKVGWDIDLAEKNRFIELIRKVVAIDGEDFLHYQEKCKLYAKTIFLNKKNLDANRDLFFQG